MKKKYKTFYKQPQISIKWKITFFFKLNAGGQQDRDRRLLRVQNKKLISRGLAQTTQSAITELN